MVPDNLLKAIVLNEERIGNLGKQIRVVVALPTPVKCIFIRARGERSPEPEQTLHLKWLVVLRIEWFFSGNW